MPIAPSKTDREDPRLPDGEMFLHIELDFEQGRPQTRWYLSRLMQFDGGAYTIKAIVDDAASWWIGRRSNESQMVMAHTLNQGVISKDVFIPAGIQRLDILIENLAASPTPTYVAFSIWQSGRLIYASDPEGWLADYAPIPDEALAGLGDPRRGLPVFSVLPNWKNGVTERLSWSTDVMQSESGAEQRRALRPHPRRSFEATFLRKGVTRSIMDNFFVAVGRNEFMLPLWHEAVRMTQGITTDAIGVSFDGTAPMSAREFRKGDLVFVNNGDPKIYDILEVGDVAATRFDWKEPPLRNWPKGTRIYPMRQARIIDLPQMFNVTDQVARVQVRFDLTEPDKRTPSWGAEFEGQGVFTFYPNRVEPVQFTYDRLTYTLDNDSSAIGITDPGRETQIDANAVFMLRGRAAVVNLRNFLAAARGQAVGFYMMTYTDDIELSADVSSANAWIDVRDSSYSEYMEFQQPVRLMVGVWTYERGWIIRVITGADPGRLHLNSPLPSLQRYEIRRICFVTPARFAQDSVELQHVTAESSVVTTRLMFRQIFNKRLAVPA